MTNYENLKAAAQSLGDFCDNHEGGTFFRSGKRLATIIFM